MTEKTTRPADAPDPDEVPDLPALDEGDEDPDSLADTLTVPDFDLSHLHTEDDPEDDDDA